MSHTSLFTLESGQKNFEVFPLNLQKKIASILIKPQFSLILTERGELYKLGDIPISTENSFVYNSNLNKTREIPEKMNEFRNIRVKMITCASSVIHCLTDEGIVYVWGNDEENYGVLGLGQVKSQSYPLIMPSFHNRKIKYIHAGKKHVGAIDIKGRIYLWGTGYHGELGHDTIVQCYEPMEIGGFEILNAQTIICHNHCTAIITIGGYLYFYGSLSKNSSFNPKPFQISALYNIFIKSLIFANNIVVALSRNGQLIFINKTLNNLKFDLDFNVKSLSKSNTSVIALTNINQIFIWNIEDLNKINQNSKNFNLFDIKQIYSLDNYSPEALILYPNASEQYNILGIETMAEKANISEKQQENLENFNYFNEKNTKELNYSIILNESYGKNHQFQSKTEKTNKIIALQKEIEMVFSKNQPEITKKPRKIQNLIKEMDESFEKKRNIRKNEVIKYQKKIELLSKEINKNSQKLVNFDKFEKFEENQKKIENWENFEKTTNFEKTLENQENHNNNNFSFAQKNEKSLEYLLNLIKSRKNHEQSSQNITSERVFRAKTPENHKKSTFLMTECKHGRGSFIMGRTPSEEPKTKKLAYNSNSERNPKKFMIKTENYELDEDHKHEEMCERDNENNEKNEKNVNFLEKIEKFRKTEGFLEKIDNIEKNVKFQQKNERYPKNVEISFETCKQSPQNHQKIIDLDVFFPKNSEKILKKPELLNLSNFMKNKKLSKRMFTFGLENLAELPEKKTDEKSKYVCFDDKIISEMNTVNTMTERGILSTKNPQSKRNTFENNSLLIEIASRISGNIDELLGKLEYKEKKLKKKTEYSAVFSACSEKFETTGNRNQAFEAKIRCIFIKRKIEVFYLLREYHLKQMLENRQFLVFFNYFNGIFRSYRKNLLKAGFFAVLAFGERAKNNKKNIENLRKINSFLIIKSRKSQYEALFKLKSYGNRLLASELMCFSIEKIFQKRFFAKIQLFINRKSILLDKIMNILAKSLKKHSQKAYKKLRNCVNFSKKCENFSKFLDKFEKSKLSNLFLENLKKLCSEQIKKEHKKTLKNLGFNKLLFIVFEIFHQRLKNVFIDMKKPRKHEKKTSYRDIMLTMESLAKHQMDLGISNGNDMYYVKNIENVNKNNAQFNNFGQISINDQFFNNTGNFSINDTGRSYNTKLYNNTGPLKSCNNGKYVSNGRKIIINKIQIECLFLALGKVLKRTFESFFERIKENSDFNKKKIIKSENFPRKLTRKELMDLEKKRNIAKIKGFDNEIENIIFSKKIEKEENNNKNCKKGEICLKIEKKKYNHTDVKNSYFEINRRKRQKSNELPEKTLNLNNSIAEIPIEKDFNHSFGDISKILLSNSKLHHTTEDEILFPLNKNLNESDISLFKENDIKKKPSNSLTPCKNSVEKPKNSHILNNLPNNSKKLAGHMKLLSSDFNDPKDPNISLSDNIKEDYKEFGLADPHEFLEESLFGSKKPRLFDPIEKFQTPELFFQDLNNDIISPKMTQKPKINQNYCSLVEYKSISPNKISRINKEIMENENLSKISSNHENFSKNSNIVKNRENHENQQIFENFNKNLKNHENTPNTSHFEGYLKEFKENKTMTYEPSIDLSHRKEHNVLANIIDPSNRTNINRLDSDNGLYRQYFINSTTKNKGNNDVTAEITMSSKYSSGSTNNYKKVIENQKKFIGNYHKQVYNTISGKIASPSYQQYLNERKKI